MADVVTRPLAGRAVLVTGASSGIGRAIAVAAARDALGRLDVWVNNAAAKGGVLAFSKSLARSVAPRVRVNVIAPGWIETSFAANLLCRRGGRGDGAA